MPNLLDGFFRFKKDVFPGKRQLYRDLASGQNPHTLFITCADSRVVPNIIMQSDPGELFMCRTVGNQIPPYGAASEGGVASSIEYALQVLGVEQIVVCGHSDCGAMKAVLHPETLACLPTTAAWLHHASAARSVVLENYPDLPDEVLLHLLAEENVVAQLENLKTHPGVAARLARGDVQLHGWLYYIHSGEITAYNVNTGAFSPVGKDNGNATPQRRIPVSDRVYQGAA